MIVGRDILNIGAIRGGSEANLKNSTFDLTIGKIVPIGEESVNEVHQGRSHVVYYLKPREIVFVLSTEEFDLPAYVTGLATLRTTYTKKGILALNVGIIDPFFKGPISTALINFSDRPRRIELGEKFFRVAFFEHFDVTKYRPSSDESVDRETYEKRLAEAAYSEFSPNFLNIPVFDDDFYNKRFGKSALQLIKRHWLFSGLIALYFFLQLMFLVEKGFLTYLGEVGEKYWPILQALLPLVG